MHGQFVWYELMTSDLAAAKKFYPTVTGWGTEDWDKSEYTMWTAGGIPLGGIVQLRPDQIQQGMPTSWMPYIEANDVDATARKAASIGGRLLFGPQDIPGTGRFAVVSDPQGAVFAIYKSMSPSEAFDGDPIVGHFSWHELMTTDLSAAFNFYRNLFGWEKTSDFEMGPDGKYQMYGMGGKEFGGMYNRPAANASAPPSWLCYVHVADLKMAVSAATRGGAKLVNGPMEVPGGGWIAALIDPQGAAFALHQAAGKNKKADKRTAKKADKTTDKKADKRADKKAVRKTVKKAARKGPKKAARKPARKAARRTAKKAARSSAKKTAKRKGRKR